MNSDEYRANIDRLIRENDGEVVLNGSPAHAAIIIERMFANAKGDVSILSRTLDPRIFGALETLEQAELFLGERSRTASIIIEEGDRSITSEHPFFVRNRLALERGNLKLWRLPKELANALKINFAIMDDRGYRFVKNKFDEFASAAFGKTDFVKELRVLFDAIADLSKRIEVRESVS